MSLQQKTKYNSAVLTGAIPIYWEGQEPYASFCSLTCNPLHLHAPSLDASLGQPLLGDDAADVVGEDEVGLQDGKGLGVRVGARLVDDDVQRSAVVLNTRHLHVLLGRRRGRVRETEGERERENERQREKKEIKRGKEDMGNRIEGIREREKIRDKVDDDDDDDNSVGQLFTLKTSRRDINEIGKK